MAPASDVSHKALLRMRVFIFSLCSFLIQDIEHARSDGGGSSTVLRRCRRGTLTRALPHAPHEVLVCLGLCSVLPFRHARDEGRLCQETGRRRGACLGRHDTQAAVWCSDGFGDQRQLGITDYGPIQPPRHEGTQRTCGWQSLRSSCLRGVLPAPFAVPAPCLRPTGWGTRAPAVRINPSPHSHGRVGPCQVNAMGWARRSARRARPETTAPTACTRPGPVAIPAGI